MGTQPTGAAGAPWRILLVDDSVDDADLTEHALRTGGLDVACRRVDSADGVRDALAGFAPQAVLCDVNLPGFSGAEALQQVRAHDPALPFVFLTGSTLFVDEAPPPADGLLLKDDLHGLPDLLLGLLLRAGS